MCWLGRGVGKIYKENYVVCYIPRCDLIMVEIIDSMTAKVIENNGVTRLTLKSGWDSILNMEAGEEIEIALANGKHGLHLAAWSKENQPKIGEIEKKI
jgi:hypothetical protein